VPNYKVEGIVLKARNFGEADRILTILDRDLGKLEGVAKGARRTRSVLRGPCQLFSHNLFFLWQGRTLDGISQCEVIESFARLRDDLLKLAAASYMAELVDDVARERDPSPEAFDLLLGSFRWLETADATPASVTHVLRSFDLRLLGLAGFAPVLDACATCGTSIEGWAGSGGLAFSAAAGGIVCPSCRVASAAEGGFGDGGGERGGGEGDLGGGGREGEGRPGLGTETPGPPVILLAVGTLAAMRHLARSTPEQARILRLTPRAAKEMERALRAHILYHLDRRLKSLDFLDSVLR
jgi:DNA repair protein RecO (recombination protein O)